MDSRWRGNDVKGEGGNPNQPVRACRGTTAIATAICLLAACAALLGVTSAQAQSNDNQRSSEEAQAKQKLDAVRAEIRAISEAQKQIAAQKSDTTAALRAQELKISATAKDVRALDQKLEGSRRVSGSWSNSAMHSKRRSRRNAKRSPRFVRPMRLAATRIAPAAGAGRGGIDRPPGRLLPLFRTRALPKSSIC